MISWLCCFWAMVRKNVLVEGYGGAKLLLMVVKEQRE
jgi:hypothetical protein